MKTLVAPAGGHPAFEEVSPAAELVLQGDFNARISVLREPRAAAWAGFVGIFARCRQGGCPVKGAGGSALGRPSAG